VTPHALLIGYVVLARLAELFVARRNTRRLLVMGGYEVGSGHYPLIVTLHVGWVLALALLVPTATSPQPHFLALFALIQPFRYWIIHSLGSRWTTRVIVVPGLALVRNGPYRWLRHPNYMVVVAEIALLPLVFWAWEIALGFSLLNAIILLYRCRIEDRALATA